MGEENKVPGVAIAVTHHARCMPDDLREDSLSASARIPEAVCDDPHQTLPGSNSIKIILITVSSLLWATHKCRKIIRTAVVDMSRPMG